MRMDQQPGEDEMGPTIRPPRIHSVAVSPLASSSPSLLRGEGGERNARDHAECVCVCDVVLKRLQRTFLLLLPIPPLVDNAQTVN